MVSTVKGIPIRTATAAHAAFGLTDDERFWLVVEIGLELIAERTPGYTDAGRKALVSCSRYWNWVQARFAEADAALLHTLLHLPDEFEGCGIDPWVYAKWQRCKMPEQVAMRFRKAPKPERVPV